MARRVVEVREAVPQPADLLRVPQQLRLQPSQHHVGVWRRRRRDQNAQDEFGTCCGSAARVERTAHRAVRAVEPLPRPAPQRVATRPPALPQPPFARLRRLQRELDQADKPPAEQRERGPAQDEPAQLGESPVLRLRQALLLRFRCRTGRLLRCHPLCCRLLHVEDARQSVEAAAAEEATGRRAEEVVERVQAVQR